MLYKIVQHSRFRGAYFLRSSVARSSNMSTTTVTAERTEIAELIQKRVQERDGWKVNGVVEGMQPPGRAAFQFFREMWKFSPPSQEELDQEFPVQSLDWSRIQNFCDPSKIQISWLGHASLLVQLPGATIVTDPVFSERPSAVQWLGPKRYRPPPCALSDLCQKVSMDVVLISHNHYDHLDFLSVQMICNESPDTQFVVPLGLKQWFRKHVSQSVVIHELDWHESAVINGTKITAVPMRHWSNRVGDRDKTLWCGYSAEAETKRFLFPGDTAWFDDLVELGERYGPFDLAAIPIGAYEPREFMKHYHVNPEEAVRMKDAVKAESAVPIHYGTFPLTTEPVLEPPELLGELMKHRKDADSFVPWLIGETKIF